VRAFWPAGEASQADYESLRQAALPGTLSVGVAARRFMDRGLVGLISAPVAEAEFVATLVPGRRPAWHPYDDPRLDLLGLAFHLVLATKTSARVEETG
jgi:hypothetical protein